MVKAIWMLVAIPALGGCDVGPATTPAKGTTAQEAPATPWTYSSSTDEMRGTKSTTASVKSTDSFKGPIAWVAQPTELAIRQSGRSQDVIVRNDNLPFNCFSIADTYMSVKFDDGTVAKYRCTEESSGQIGVAFLRPESKFIAKLKSAKHLIIEAEVLVGGEQQMHFDVVGLKWEDPPSSRKARAKQSAASEGEGLQ